MNLQGRDEKIGGQERKRRLEVIARHPARIHMEIPDGVVLIGSDAHYWPGLPRSTAHSAFVRLLQTLNPTAVILNGDIIDAPTASVHPSIGWEKRPALAEEIGAAQERLREIRRVTCFDARCIWTLGNHDLRFETYLARVAPEYHGVFGIHLKDHFPNWEPAWDCWINGIVSIKHRWHTGIHAARNNTLGAGISMVTGHLHSLKVWPHTNYLGTTYGVDSGTLAVPYGPQFYNYTEGNPVDWRAGFVVLTFVDGLMLPPELLTVMDEETRLTAFRGVLHQED